MTKDINIFESGSGGEMKVLNGDLLLAETLFQTIYLALFGGNLEADTTGNETETQERLDWWGNELFYPNNPKKWFNSETERALKDNALNSQGRQSIQQSIENDLQFLNDIVDYRVEVFLINFYKVKISIFVTETENQDDRLLELVWDNAKDEIIINQVI